MLLTRGWCSDEYKARHNRDVHFANEQSPPPTPNEFRTGSVPVRGRRVATSDVC